VRPALKWAGGKTWALDLLRTHVGPALDAGARLVDPFCGAATVALGLRPRRALLADVNADLINFHRWAFAGLSFAGGGLTLGGRYLGRCDFDPAEPEDYYRTRAAFNYRAHLGTRGAWDAWAFWTLNRYGFNGLCRYNAGGRFNVSRGSKRTAAEREDFADIAEAVAGLEWDLRAAGFEAVLEDLAPGDVLVVDPPYHGTFDKYAGDTFGAFERECVAIAAERHDGPVVAFDSWNDYTRNLYEECVPSMRLRQGEAPRSISRTGDRTPALELFAWKC